MPFSLQILKTKASKRGCSMKIAILHLLSLRIHFTRNWRTRAWVAAITLARWLVPLPQQTAKPSAPMVPDRAFLASMVVAYEAGSRRKHAPWSTWPEHERCSRCAPRNTTTWVLLLGLLRVLLPVYCLAGVANHLVDLVSLSCSLMWDSVFDQCFEFCIRKYWLNQKSK